MKRPVKFQRRKKRSHKYPETHQLQLNSQRAAIHKNLLKIFDKTEYSAQYVSENDLCDLDWYPSWLERQLSSVPHDLVQISCHEPSTPSDSDSEHDDQPRQISLEALDPLFWKIWGAIAKSVSNYGDCVIDDLVLHLIKDEKHFIESENDQRTEYYQRQLVFAVLGWQSMLYSPTLDYGEEYDLTISLKPEQIDSGLVIQNASIGAGLADKDMCDLLKRYGNLLPPRSPKPPTTGPGSSKEASTLVSFAPADMNIHILSTLLHLRIQWVELMSLHLDYDQGTRTLSLFRYPSMCVAALRSRGTLYSFAKPSWDANPSDATHSDVTSMVQEICSSYRLLFGQSVKSRQYFQRQIRRLNPTLFSNDGDTLLLKLCSEKTMAHGGVPPDRPLYFAERDFPVLGDRLKMLVDDLNRAKPKTWMGLLRDRRDITQYWTFWLVAIFGSVSILLGIVQAVLQGLSLKSTSSG